MERFYGDYIVGEWVIDGDDKWFFPRELKIRENEFEWKPLHEGLSYAWPHKDGKPLVYDESA